MDVIYVIVGFIIMLVIFGVAIGMLTGALPSFEQMLSFITGG